MEMIELGEPIEFECPRCGLRTKWNAAKAKASKLTPACPNCHRPLEGHDVAPAAEPA